VLESREGIEWSIEAAAEGRVPDRGDYLHCRYELDGSHTADDWPTFQLDGPGIWLWSFAHHARAGGTVTGAHREAASLVARYVAALRDTPSFDAWEEFGQHVHTSTQAAILAGLRAAESLGVETDDVAGARRDHEASLLVPDGRAWTKWAGMDAVDASLLWIAAPYGLVPPDHPRFAATLARIETELVSPAGGVHRYRDDTYYGGGEWILLTAALGRVLLRRDGPGDRERAEHALGWIEDQAAPDGTLPEQVATHALAPERIDEWRASWGESARPLLWSHATYLALRAELDRS
jgi:GH15 family glucan-1,4-alpha-glucosidase